MGEGLTDSKKKDFEVDGPKSFPVNNCVIQWPFEANNANSFDSSYPKR
jgi:hypothetical protein